LVSGARAAMFAIADTDAIHSDANAYSSKGAMSAIHDNRGHRYYRARDH
jgi:hypothetical protein